MSPTMPPVPAMEPSQGSFFAFGEGGTTSAMGSPNFVTRTGLHVLRTRSRTARQVALNLEIAISSMMPATAFVIVRDHSQRSYCSTAGRERGCSARLANYGTAGKTEGTIPMVSQTLLAEMIGASRPRVSLLMNKFRKLGFIEYDHGLTVHGSLLAAVLPD